MKHFRLISKIFTPALAVMVIGGALVLASPSLTYAVDGTSATPPATNSTGATPTNPDDQINCNILPQEICNEAKSKTKSDGSAATDAKGTAIYDLLIWVLKILTALVGVAAVGALVYAGILYSSASNDSAQVSKAKTIIRDTVVGIVVYGFMFLILNWLIPGGVLG